LRTVDPSPFGLLTSILIGPAQLTGSNYATSPSQLSGKDFLTAGIFHSSCKVKEITERDQEEFQGQGRETGGVHHQLALYFLVA
jgi:hypothetical protein